VLVVADSPLPRVTICVPVFNGAQWVAESLASVARQTFTDLEVLISDDASTDASARICREVAAADPRFRLVIQPARLGWMENCNWMLSRARGEFVYIHGHDDILEARCIATLVAHLDVTPACCVAFSDMRAFGTEDHVLSQPSITGSPFERAYDVMAHHYNAIAFSGLMRTAVARSGLRGNDHDNFSADSTWLMRLARAGELHRVAEVLFHKRFHGNMSHFQWTQWDEDRKISAWCGHCAGILGEALAFDLTPAQQWLLVWAALQRLLLAATSLGPYQFIRDLALDRKAAMVSDFFATMSEPLRRHGWAAGDLQMTAGTAISIADALAAPYANLTSRLRRAETESHRQINQLTEWLKESNADRETLHEQNRKLTDWLKEANADRESGRRELAEQASRISTLAAELASVRARRERWPRLSTCLARLRAIFW
jgi:Glycosyl transferase family 2